MSQYPPAEPNPQPPYPYPPTPVGPSLGRTTGPFLDGGARPPRPPEPPGPRHPDARLRHPWRGPWCVTLGVLLTAFLALAVSGLSTATFCAECDPVATAALHRAQALSGHWLLGGLAASGVLLLAFWLVPPRERHRTRRALLGFAAGAVMLVGAAMCVSVVQPYA